MMKGFSKLLLTLAFVAAALGALALVMAGFGTRLGFWDFRGGFDVMRWGAYLALGGIVGRSSASC
jgi:hypothetical protein